MQQPLEIDYLKPFIESSINAAARFRRVLIVMITASILALGAFWNSLEETWFNSRITAARKGEALLTLEYLNSKLKKIERGLNEIQEKEIQEKEKQKLDEEKVRALEEKRLGLWSEKDDLLSEVKKILIDRFGKHTEIKNAEELDRELTASTYSGARQWIKQRMMADREQAAYYILRLEDARTRGILLVHIPFFGVVFDVNSLGLWGGITFSVVLLIFRFSLWREYNNLRLTFKEAKPEHQRFCYMSLAMEQVLTVPPPLYRSQKDLRPRSWVVQALYFPPLIIQGAIVLNDVRTQDVGSIFSSKLTLFSTGASLLFFFLIGVLTRKCLDLSSAIDGEWKNAAEKVRAGELEKWDIR